MTRSPLSASSARCCFFSSTSRLVTTALFILLASQACSAAYYGKLIGKLSQFHHGVSGEVYAVDGRTLHIKDFTYDGEGPAAYFYVGNSKTINANGFRVRDERGKSDVLRGYRKRDVTLTLPEGKTLNNIKWFAVYCDEYEVNFGDVRIPRGFDYPRPQKLAALNGVHGVSSEPIVVVDAQTLLIPGFSYDGEAPDAKFWVGSGPHPSPQGIRVPDENGKFQPLRLYQRKTIVLTLPGDLTVHQLGHFGVWCEAFTVDFGHVQIPPNLNVPPSLKMLGVSPQNLREGQGQTTGGVAGLLAASNPRALVFDGTSVSPSYYSQSPASSESTGGASSISLRAASQQRQQQQQQQHERPTTYRPPIFRRSDDRVQVIQALDYRIPKSLRTEDFSSPTSTTIQQQQFDDDAPSTRLAAPVSGSTIFLEDGANFGASSSLTDRDGSDDRATTRAFQPNRDSQRPLADNRRGNFPGGSTIYHHIREGAPQAASLGQSVQQQQQQQQQSSYARVRSFQGDQRVDSYSKLNCEVLEDSLAFEVRWAVAGDSIVVQLVGKLDAGQYMSFGVSSTPERSVMVGGDVAVAWVDKQTLQGYAVDYFLEAKSQCSGGRGSCPDTRIQDNSNSVRLLNAAMVNGYSIVTYQRPLKASDELDRAIRTNGSQAIIWAVGPLNERNEVSFHSHYLKTDKFIEFGRPPAWNCPMPDGDLPDHTDNVEKESVQELVATTRRPQKQPVQATPAPAATTDAWTIPPIQCNEPDDGVLYAQMGPTGGTHGYPAITGHVGWGISWYINGLLIPEIYVVRGRNYTFVTEGGVDAEIPARYHPFYITDDPVGGYQHKTPEEKAKVKIFAGVRRQRGNVIPTGTGRLCNWIPDPTQPADDFASFGAYQRTLTLTCDNGEPGFVQWTPDANTPDTVYYQCFTHRYLGWKIHVVDSCDLPAAAASETHEVYAAAPQSSDLESGASIRVPIKVTPAPDSYDHHVHHHHNHHDHLHHRHPQQDQASHYQLHQHRHYNPYYHPPTNDKPLATSSPGGPLTASASSMHNTANGKSARLTSPRVNGVSGVAAGYELREPYEPSMHSHSYEAHAVRSPMRPPLYQPMKPLLAQPNHHHHHYHRHPALHHLPPQSFAAMRSQPTFPFVRSHPRLVPSASRASVFHRETAEPSIGWPGSSRNDLPSGAPSNADSVNVAGHQQTAVRQELDQEVQQSVPMPVGALAPSNQPSVLVPDQRPIVSHGQTKFPAGYPHPGAAQYVFSRPAAAHSNPHKTSQLMILRRPILQLQLQQEQQLQLQLQQQQEQEHQQHQPQQLQLQHRQLQLQHQHEQQEQKQQQQLQLQHQQLQLQLQHEQQQLQHQHQQLQQHEPQLQLQQQPLQRRPIAIPGDQDVLSQPRQVFIERKKATYQPQPSRKRIAIGKSPPRHQTKFSKLENKQRAKIEAKMSMDAGTIAVDRSPGRSTSAVEPARNTGFDPDSIVIESGFRPIVRHVERDTSSGRSQDFRQIRQGEGSPIDETGENDEAATNLGQENFEPMFVPSPPDRDSLKKQLQLQQQRKKNQRAAAAAARQKTRLDDLDDMEMAADRLDGFYLPPSGMSVAARRIEERIGASGGALIAFDGKRVEDASLARSIPRVAEKQRPRGRLTSEVLSRTPQFGAFRGELPPPIPRNVGVESLTQLGSRGGSSKDREAKPETRGSTRLTPVERGKRSSGNRPAEAMNSTVIHGHEGFGDRSMQDRSMQDHSTHDHSTHNHSTHDHSKHDHSKHSSSADFDRADDTGRDHDEKSTLTSTGQMVINEMPYVLLTIVLYFAI